MLVHCFGLVVIFSALVDGIEGVGGPNDVDVEIIHILKMRLLESVLYPTLRDCPLFELSVHSRENWMRALTWFLRTVSL